MPAALSGARLAQECNICFRQLKKRTTKRKTKTKNRKSPRQKSNPQKSNQQKNHQPNRTNPEARTPLKMQLKIRTQVLAKIKSPLHQNPLRTTTRKNPILVKNQNANSSTLLTRQRCAHK